MRMQELILTLMENWTSGFPLNPPDGKFSLSKTLQRLLIFPFLESLLHTSDEAGLLFDEMLQPVITCPLFSFQTNSCSSSVHVSALQ